MIYSFAFILIFLFCSIRAIKGFNLWRKGNPVDAEIIGYRYTEIPWYRKISTQFDNMGFFPVVAFKQNGKQEKVTLEKETLFKPIGHKVRIRISGKQYLSVYLWVFDIMIALIILSFLFMTLPAIPLMFFEQVKIMEKISSFSTSVILPTLVASFATFLISEFFHVKSLQSYKSLFWVSRLRKQKNIPQINEETARVMKTKKLVTPEEVLAYKNCRPIAKTYYFYQFGILALISTAFLLLFLFD